MVGWAGGGLARRRRLRDVAGWLEVRPRRGRCRICQATHVLLPSVALLRRVDLARVIGLALLAKTAGRGHRQAAAELGVPATTVRGWLRRFAERAELVRGLKGAQTPTGPASCPVTPNSGSVL